MCKSRMKLRSFLDNCLKRQAGRAILRHRRLPRRTGTSHARKCSAADQSRVAQICLFIFAAIALFGGALQMYLYEPETTPRLDNVHRFMAGTYFGAGMICLWAAATIRRQSTLVFLLALGVFLAGLA